MKTWNEAEIKELEINQTAFGPSNPDNEDEAKYEKFDQDGKFIGWETLYGESKAN